jgi:hypothetical protein
VDYVHGLSFVIDNITSGLVYFRVRAETVANRFSSSITLSQTLNGLDITRPRSEQSITRGTGTSPG